MAENEVDRQKKMISELLVKAAHSADFLVKDLRGLSHYSNALDDRALNVLARQLTETTCKISAILSELQPQ